MTTRPILILTLALALAGGAEALAASKKHVAPKNEFTDLPGVTTPEDELQARHACTTELRPTRIGPHGARYLTRVYVCQDNNFVYEGSNPPDEYEWRQIRQRRGY